jgi:hypothetical protein
MFSFLEDEDFAPRTPRKPRKNLRRTSGAKRGEDREFIAWDGEGWTEHVCDIQRDGKNATIEMDGVSTTITYSVLALENT